MTNNTDLISREQAIDCLNGKITMPDDMMEPLRAYLQGVIDAIEALPPVTPMQSGWIPFSKYYKTGHSMDAITRTDERGKVRNKYADSN